MSLVGAGAGTALRYTIDGVTYRTFTTPAPDVKDSTLAALDYMGITHDATSQYDAGEIIFAHTPNRSIEIEVEPITGRATRVRIAVKNGSLLYDNATAREIVAQTERLLAASAARETAARAIMDAASGETAAKTLLRLERKDVPVARERGGSLGLASE